MTFDVMMEDVQTLSNNFEATMARYAMFAEASWNEFLTNKEEAQLKVIKESGTEEDYQYLEAAAEEGLMVRAKNTIAKMKESFIAFIKSLWEKITSFFASAGDSLKQIEKKIHADPKLKNEKIKIKDVKKMEAAEKEIDGKFKQLFAKMKAGKDVTDAEIEAVSKESNNIWKAAVAAVATVTVGGVIAFIMSNKNDKPAGNLDVEGLPNNIKDPTKVRQFMNALQGHIKVKSAIEREKMTAKFMGPYKAMKAKITGWDVAPTIDKDRVRNDEKQIIELDRGQHKKIKHQIKESAMDTDAILDQIILEATRDVEDLDKPLFESSSDEGVTPSEYLDYIESVLEENNDSEGFTLGDAMAYIEAALEEAEESSLEDGLDKLGSTADEAAKKVDDADIDGAMKDLESKLKDK